MGIATTTLLRPAAALAAAALALHELRYRLADAGHGEAAVVASGHGYVPLAQAVVVLLLVLAGAVGLRATARGGDRPAAGGGPAGDWARASAVLLLVHLGQESAERLLLHGGRPPGWEAVLGGGTWVSVPLALVLGAVVALLLRGADHAQSAVGRVVRPSSLGAPGPTTLHSALPGPPDRPLAAALATGRAGRAPPLSAA